MKDSTRKRARCIRTAFDELECTLPHYHEGVIDEWKQHIPYRCRTYLSATKAWRFWGGYQELAADIVLDHFPGADLPRRARPYTRASDRPAGSDHFTVLHLLPSAPRELVDAAYRTLAKSTHPDVGGSDSAMRRLTEARDALSRRLSA